MVISDYLWIDSNGNIHSKLRILNDININNYTIIDFPEWEYDGSSLGEATVSNSEIILKPCSIFKCPFRENGLIVLCDTYYPDGNPTLNNYRYKLNELLKQQDEDPLFGIEQEFFICDKISEKPVGNPPLTDDIIRASYCGCGTGYIYYRNMIDKFLDYALKAGINIYGINAEVSLGQWEYQIGTCNGMEVCDQLWVARYIMEKISEEYNVIISLDPKPIQHINGSGCHTNYSTRSTRNTNGIETIHKYIEKLSEHHGEVMKHYGRGNERRLTGKHETSSYEYFTWGIGSRDTSVRIPIRVFNNRYGYLEDRRPASNMNPYEVVYFIIKNTIFD